MTIHVNAETVRQLVEKHVQNLYPGKLAAISENQPCIATTYHEQCQPVHSFNGYLVEILDQSPFDMDQNNTTR